LTHPLRRLSGISEGLDRRRRDRRLGRPDDAWDPGAELIGNLERPGHVIETRQHPGPEHHQPTAEDLEPDTGQLLEEPCHEALVEEREREPPGG
jgi:hypothetical protein